MGIFDVIEMKNHCQAIGEYLLYLDNHHDEIGSCSILMSDHLKKIITILDKFEKSD